MDRLGRLDAFVRVAQLGSFTAAAHALGVSKSSVSKQIAALEEELGARLLHRTTRRVSLTDAGRGLYERARSILEQVDEAERSVAELHGELRGTLRITVPLTFGTRVLAPLLAAYLERHPQLRAEIDASDRVVDIVADGYDLAVRIGRLPQSELVARRLAPAHHVLCAAPRYLDRRGRPRHPQDLKEHDVLVYSYAAASSQLRFENASGSRASVHVEGTVRANNGELLAACAHQGLGIVLLPDFIVAEQLRTGELRTVLPEWALDGQRGFAVWAVYPHRPPLTAKVRSLVDFLVERLGDDGGADTTISAG